MPSKIERGWQSRKEAVISLRKEAKTLQALEAFDLSFEVPSLVCLVRDDSVEPVGLIESAVRGRPLLPENDSETALEIIANVAGAIHSLPKTDIGHPAYDLAIVTAGVRRPLGITDGLQRLVDLYNETAPQKIEPEEVIVYELLLHLNWLAEAAQRKRHKDAGGHGPDHYARLIRGILRRAKA